MNIAQQCFAILYAVFWAGVLGALSKWRAFDTGVGWTYRDEHARKRFRWSVFILNLIPLIWLMTVLHMLSTETWQCWPLRIRFQQAILLAFAVLPAFAIFGFYRFWLFIVVRDPEQFYPYLHPYHWKEQFPNLHWGDKTEVDSKQARAHLSWALWYVGLPAFPLLLIYLVDFINAPFR